MSINRLKNQLHSIILTKYSINIAIILIIAVFILMPFSQKILDPILPIEIKDTFQYMYFTIYIGGLLGLGLMFFLLKLIKNLQANIIFDWQNIHYLNVIAWMCFLGAIVGLLSAIYLIYWLPVGLMASFIFLIIRVIKSILIGAIRLKEENDYTI